MRRVLHDGEGHVIADSTDGDQWWIPRRRGSVVDRSTSATAAAADVTDDDGVSTIRFQELYSRASRHLVRVTASRVDALGNHSSPFGETSSQSSSTSDRTSNIGVT